MSDKEVDGEVYVLFDPGPVVAPEPGCHRCLSVPVDSAGTLRQAAYWCSHLVAIFTLFLQFELSQGAVVIHHP